MDRLINSDYLENYQMENLAKWIENNFSKEFLKVPVKDDGSASKDKPDLESYLLIIISTLGGEITKKIGKRFYIQGQLIENFDRDYIDTKRSCRVNLNTEDINDEWYLEKELEKELPNIICKYIYEVIGNDAYLGEKIKKGQTCNLKIELFLPKEFFTKDFDFKIPDVWKKDEYRICEKYPVTLRSIDRLQRNEWRNRWNSKWAKIKRAQNNEIIDFDRFFDKDPGDNKDRDTESYLKLLSTAKKQKQLRNILSKIIILKISSGLPSRQEEINSLFEIILEQGIPLCLWIKSKEQIDAQTYQLIIKKFDDLATNESLHNTNSLCEKIFQLRKEDLAKDKPENHLGFHLRVMYDDNERIPREPEQLSSSS